jgi:predicted transcriptional regulator
MEHLTKAGEVARTVSGQIAESGITVVRLCEKTGIPRTTMIRRLSGQSPFNLNELDRIAAALRVDVDSLLTDRVAS